MVLYISAVGSVDELSLGVLQEIGMKSVEVLVKCIIPLGLIAIAVAVIVTGVQTKFLITMKPVGFKLKNLNPLNGIKKLFSVTNLVELLKAALKIIILTVVLYQILKNEIVVIAQMMDMNAVAGFSYVLKEIMGMVVRIGLVFAVIAGFDYFYQRWSYEKKLKMTKEEVKEEYKQMEGNPEADVIIRNPTHYAVALKYDIDHDNAPVLIAKGQDYVALKIVEIAEQSNVMVIENKPLARGIYATTPLNCEIPAEYYGVVAEILVKVFRMNKKLG